MDEVKCDMQEWQLKKNVSKKSVSKNYKDY